MEILPQSLGWALPSFWPRVFLEALIDCTQTKQNGELMLRKRGCSKPLGEKHETRLGPRVGWAQHLENVQKATQFLFLSFLLWSLPGSDSSLRLCICFIFLSPHQLLLFLQAHGRRWHLLAPNFLKPSVQANRRAGPLSANSKVTERNLIS